MNMTSITAAWKSFAAKLNQSGIPIPTVRDPLTGKGSVSLALVYVSSLIYIVGMFGKWSGKFGGIDMPDAREFFNSTCYLYFGRSIVKVAHNVMSRGSSDSDDGDSK